MAVSAMVTIYASLVKNGRRTIESLPAEYQESVRQKLAEDE